MPSVKTIVGIVAGGTLLAGGGAVTADQMINPYASVQVMNNGVPTQALEIAASSTLPEAGTDATIVDTTQPKITLSKWNGEVAMGVTYEGIQATGARPFLSKNVDWSQGNQTMEAVPIDDTTTMEDGGMEININLASKPASNVFYFAISGAEDLDFFYQPPLNQDNPNISWTCSDTECNDQLGNIMSQRPHNVVGSYAVYYRSHRNHVEGQVNYSSGKAFHIYRPLVSDATGATIWANLSYSNGLLTVTVPQTFLDTATYPVKVDPVFGRNSIGASLGVNASADRGEFGTATTTVAGTATSITVRLTSTSGTPNMKGLVFDADGAGGIPNTLIATGGIVSVNAGTGVGMWATSTLSFSMLSNHVYFLGYVSDSLGMQISYDTSSPALGRANFNVPYASPINPWNSDIASGARYVSAYITYTAGGGTTPDSSYIVQFQ